MTRLNNVALAWLALGLALLLVNVLLPQPFGLTAPAAILEPYIVLTALAAGIVAARRFPRIAPALLVALLAVAVPRYLPAWTSSPPPPDSDQLTVSTWNFHAGGNAADRALLGIGATNAQLLGLQELKADVALMLTPDSTGYPHQALPADPDADDVGLLSRYPILESEISPYPAMLRAVVGPPDARPIVVYVIHAPLARFVQWAGVPVSVDLGARDAAMATIRARIDEDLAEGQSVVVMGDFNLTEREPAYALLSAGLRDAHLDAGTGPGFTWRPGPYPGLPFGLLRIDYVLSTPDLLATSATVDCSLPSDHCRLEAALNRD